MKKFIAIVLVLATVLGLCACSGKGQDVSGGKDKDGNVTINIGLETNAKIMSYTDNALTKWLEETTGYKIKFTEYTGGTDVGTQISTTVAARQDLPDIIWGIGLSEGAVSTYGKEGYFVDLTPYYEDKEGASATFWTRLEECLPETWQDYVVDKITDNDTGKIYGVPSIETSLADTMIYQPWINTKWLEAVGMDAPTNPDELYDVLVAFRDEDPNGNGQKDEIALFGSEQAYNGSYVLKWLVNMYLYYDPTHPWQDYNGDGQVEYVYTQPEYREAIEFVNKLYKEKLLHNSLYTISQSSEMKSIITPSEGPAKCGIFCGHLTSHTAIGNNTLFEYVPLKQWGYMVEKDPSVNFNCFITETAEKHGIVDECFNLLMTMWSEDGARRIRYGEKGVNWDDPTEGAMSAYGLPVDYKLINDPFTQQNTAMWGKIAGTLNHYAEAETAELASELDDWTKKKTEMLAECRRMWDAQAEAKNPKEIVSTLDGTTEEQEAIDATRTNVMAYKNSAEKDFVTGANGQKITDDGDWNAFLKKLNDLGLEEYQKYAQKCYERQYKK